MAGRDRADKSGAVPDVSGQLGTMTYRKTSGSKLDLGIICVSRLRVFTFSYNVHNKHNISAMIYNQYRERNGNGTDRKTSGSKLDLV